MASTSSGAAMPLQARSPRHDDARRRRFHELLRRDWSWAVFAAAMAAMPAVHAGLVDGTVVVFAMLLPVTLTGLRARWPAVFGIVVLCLIWACAQMLSDYANNGRVAGSSVLFPLLLAVALAGFAWVHDVDPDRYPAVLGVLFAAIFVAEVYQFRHTLRASPASAWKFGLGVPFSLAVAMVAGRSRRPLVPLVALACLALVDGVLGYRGLGVFCLMAAGVLVVRELATRGSRKVVAGAAVAGIAVLVAAALSYGELARSGVLGAAQQQKELQQSQVGPVARVIAQRPYTVGSVLAIADSPVLGFGSHPAVSPRLAHSVYDALTRLGTRPAPASAEQFLGRDLDSHSLLLGSFVTSGFLGTLPWIAALVVAYGVLRRRPAPQHRWLEPLLLVWTISTVWDVLFSPWSTHTDLFVAAWFTLALALTHARSSVPAGD